MRDTGLCKTGVTVVQLRDKTSETSELVKTAKELHKVTKAGGVPLLINDRVDVALAAGVEGVHIGQDDLGRFIICFSLPQDNTINLFGSARLISVQSP